MATKEKRGIWLLLVRNSRLSTTYDQKTSRLIPTPLVYIMRPKSVREATRASARQRDGYIPTRSIHLCNVFDWSVVLWKFRTAKNKASATRSKCSAPSL